MVKAPTGPRKGGRGGAAQRGAQRRSCGASPFALELAAPAARSTCARRAADTFLQRRGAMRGLHPEGQRRVGPRGQRRDPGATTGLGGALLTYANSAHCCMLPSVEAVACQGERAPTWQGRGPQVGGTRHCAGSGRRACGCAALCTPMGAARGISECTRKRFDGPGRSQARPDRRKTTFGVIPRSRWPHGRVGGR